MAGSEGHSVPFPQNLPYAFLPSGSSRVMYPFELNCQSSKQKINTYKIHKFKKRNICFKVRAISTYFNLIRMTK